MNIKEYTNEEKQDEQIENSRYSNDGGFESFLPGTHTIKEPTSHNISIERQTITVTSNDELQSAIDALDKVGGGVLALKAGIYIVTQEIKGISSIQIIGENKATTIIDFKSTAAKLSFTGTSIYSTGTITSITSGVNVTGSGTSWLSNLTTDHQFFIAQRWYKIAAITSDTTLTLAEGYAGGATFPGASYRTAILKKDIEIKELTFKNSTGNALDFDDCRDIVFEDISIESNNVGLTADYCSEFVGDGVIIVSSTGNGSNLTQCGFTNFTSFSTPSNGSNGVILNNCRVCTFNRSSSSSNTADGYNITSCSDILIEVEASSNGGQGIELVSGNDNIIMRTCLIASNTSDGIKLTATSDNCKIVYSDIKLNGGYGMNIAAATCDNNIITANRFSTNTSGAINDSGTATVILPNQGAGQGTSGQVLTSNGTGSAPTFQTSSSVPENDRYLFNVGTRLWASNDANKNFTVASYTKQKEISIKKGGDFTIKFTIASNNGTVFGKIYKNGVAIGTEQSRGIGSSEYSEDITGFVAGDLIQIYCYITAGTGTLSNFQLYVDQYEAYTNTVV